MGGRTVTFFTCLVSIFVLPGPLFAEPFHDPGIPDGQIVSYQYSTTEYPNAFLIDVKKGEEVLSSSSRVEVLHNQDGHKMYRIRDTGVRRNGYTFEHVSEMTASQELKSVGFVARDRNPDGRLIREIEVTFDDPTLSYPPGTFPVYCLVQAMRGAPFQQGKEVSFYVWVTPTEIFCMQLHVVRKETIQVPAGDFSCFYAEMKPDIRTLLPVGSLMAKLLQPFIPKYKFWFSCEGSHPMVKFEGVLGGAGAGKHIIELTDIEQPQTAASPSRHRLRSSMEDLQANAGPTYAQRR